MVCEKVKTAAVQGAFNNANIFSAKGGILFKHAERYFTQLLESETKFLSFAHNLLFLKKTKEKLEEDRKIYNPEVATLVLYFMMKEIDMDGLKSFLVNKFANAGTPLSRYVNDNITLETPVTEVVKIFVQYPSTITDEIFTEFVIAIDGREKEKVATGTMPTTYGEKGGETKTTLFG